MTSHLSYLPCYFFPCYPLIIRSSKCRITASGSPMNSVHMLLLHNWMVSSASFLYSSFPLSSCFSCSFSTSSYSFDSISWVIGWGATLIWDLENSALSLLPSNASLVSRFVFSRVSISTTSSQVRNHFSFSEIG